MDQEPKMGDMEAVQSSAKPIDRPSFIPERLAGFYENRIKEIANLSGEVEKVCPQMVASLPKTEEIPVDLLGHRDIWDEYDDADKAYLYDVYLGKVASQIRSILIQSKRLINKESIVDSERPFVSSYQNCFNFWSSIHPVVRRHIYDLIKPEMEPAKTVRCTVRHSIDYTVGMRGVDWSQRLQYLLDYPNYREESCYSKGRAPGDVILEVDADVREAFPRDVVSMVDPYTGHKLVEEDLYSYSGKDGEPYSSDPEEYFDQDKGKEFAPDFHNHCDELFSRFDIHKDLKRVIVADLRFIPIIQKMLEQYGLKDIPVEIES